jgi:hypothetical protein
MLQFLETNVLKKEAGKILKYKDLTTANREDVEFKTLSCISCVTAILFLMILTLRAPGGSFLN